MSIKMGASSSRTRLKATPNAASANSGCLVRPSISRPTTHVTGESRSWPCPARQRLAVQTPLATLFFHFLAYRRLRPTGTAMSQLSDEVRRYLALLELKPGASWPQVRSKYRFLSKVWHPDRFGSDARARSEAERRFQSITEAYRWLQEHERLVDTLAEEENERRFLAEQVCPPVLWERSMRGALERGLAPLAGSGDVLQHSPVHADPVLHLLLHVRLSADR